MSCLAQGDGVAEAPDREHEAVQWAEAPVAVHSLIRIDEQVAAQLTQFTRVEAHHLLAARWMLQQQVESHALWCEAWLAVSVVCDEWLQHEQPEPCCCADDVWWWWHVAVACCPLCACAQSASRPAFSVATLFGRLARGLRREYLELAFLAYLLN